METYAAYKNGNLANWSKATTSGGRGQSEVKMILRIGGGTKVKFTPHEVKREKGH